MKDIIVRIVTWVALLIAGLAGGWFINELMEPTCPQEDSCQIDYRDGGWWISPEHVDNPPTRWVRVTR